MPGEGGIGSDSTHWRTGTCGITWRDEMGSRLRHAPGAARRTEPAALAAESHELVVAAVGAAQPQKAVRQDAALQDGVELALDELWQAGTCGDLRPSKTYYGLWMPLGGAMHMLVAGNAGRPNPHVPRA